MNIALYCCRKVDLFQDLRIGFCLNSEMNCPTRHMCIQTKRLNWEGAPRWRTVGGGNPGELLCLVACNFRLYGDGISFWIANHSHLEFFLVVHALLSQDGC